MGKFFTLIFLSLAITPKLHASCNPCVCGTGGGNPPPTGCVITKPIPPLPQQPLPPHFPRRPI